MEYTVIKISVIFIAGDACFIYEILWESFSSHGKQILRNILGLNG